MCKLYRNILVTISAIIGLCVVIIGVCELLGIDLGIDAYLPKCCKKTKKCYKKPLPKAKIRRNYTQIKLAE